MGDRQQIVKPGPALDLGEGVGARRGGGMKGDGLCQAIQGFQCLEKEVRDSVLKAKRYSYWQFSWIWANTSEGLGGEEERQCLAMTSLAVIRVWAMITLRGVGKESIPKSKRAKAGFGSKVVSHISASVENILFQKLVKDLHDQKVWSRVPFWPQFLQQSGDWEG